MAQVSVRPELIRWARERAGLSQKDLVQKFKRLPQWEEGKSRPAPKQLKLFARAVHVPFGYLYLSEPPEEEETPIADFRTIAGQPVAQPSLDLKDTINSCLSRQAWYRDFIIETGAQELDFVGSASIQDSPQAIAAKMRDLLQFNLQDRRHFSTVDETIRYFVSQCEAAGILVMISGIVGSNTHRRLDPHEFRGFALSDSFAPLIFINGRDSKAARMFTLAHELAHIWLGESALSNLGIQRRHDSRQEEIWSNKVAAELLVPLAALKAELKRDESLDTVKTQMTKIFKVSNLVILKRLLDADWIHQEQFKIEWENEIVNLNRKIRKQTGGGDFYRTTVSRVGRRFAHALINSTLEGRTLYRDALRMMCISNTTKFHQLAKKEKLI